ncbi:carboxylesterase family protein [Streptomyces sp. PsTaAH-124]|uniref:carboxylesterase family protein n=1 Tax=Streptomyces sp. PsTaAH-124 TaxID=1157638 RepID=UPI003B6397A7
MGESSGGASVCARLTSPDAAGLFHRAVIESGSCLESWPKNTLASGDPAATYFAPQNELAAKGRGALGCRTLRCCRPVPGILGSASRATAVKSGLVAVTGCATPWRRTWKPARPPAHHSQHGIRRGCIPPGSADVSGRAQRGGVEDGVERGGGVDERRVGVRRR